MSASDCMEKKGSAPEGQRWLCAESTCRTEDVDSEPQGDPPDAGGEDAGPTDTGPRPDAGTVAKGEACTESVDCQLSLRCEAGAGGSFTCQALRIALTLDRGGASLVAAAVRYDAPGELPTILVEPGTWPRWSRSGDAVAAVSLAAGDMQLVRRTVVPSLGGQEVITSAGAADTLEFSQLEWGPGEVLVWTRVDALEGKSGVFAIAPTGGQAYRVTATGGFPSFAADGRSIAYSGSGLLTAPVDGTQLQGHVVPNGAGGIEPLHNARNAWLLFKRSTGRTETFALSGPESLYGVAANPSDGSAVAIIDDAQADAGTTDEGVVGYFISFHTVSDDGTLAAYTHTNYVGPEGETKTLCTTGTCSG
ncbi:MAG: hypothetical protein L0Y64_19400, partial [Myxococcaceae bacterium]|nr:hypothetical protein [Myxococcaceae bacterium]